MGPHYFCVCAVLKWEWPWIAEWLAFHRIIGVEHFFLCCNEDGPELERSLKILEPFVQEGIVSPFHVTGSGVQLVAYNHALEMAQGHTRWLGVIDLDEFLYPVATDTVTEVLQDFEDCDAVAANWQCFGSSGLVHRPKSQLRDFVRRAPLEWEVNRHIKSIVNPERTSHFPNSHFAAAHTVDENRKCVEGPFNDFTGTRLLVNHYVVRSKQDFVEVKALRGRVDGHPNDRDEQFFVKHDRNDVFDDAIARRFADRVDASLGRSQAIATVG